MFATRRRITHTFLAVCVGHVLLISAQLQSRSGMALPKAAAFRFFAAVQLTTMHAADAVHGVWTNYVALRGVNAENTRLRAQLALLEGRVQQQQAIVSDHQELEDALGLRQTIERPSLTARVIAGDPSPDVRTVTIDPGRADGVAVDLPVIAPSGGVVGRVVRVLDHAATVQLLIDRLAAAGAALERGSGGLVEGSATGPYLTMAMVSNLADVKIGDKVMTAGNDGIFPRGFLVGDIVAAEKGSGQYRSISVMPAVDFSRLDVVIVLLPSDAAGGRE